MPLYKHESFTRSGKNISGTIDATSQQAAKELLRGQGLMPVTITESSGAEGMSFLSSLFGAKVDHKTVIVFTKQLAVLLKSGVPLLKALELLVDQFEQPFQGILVSVKEGVKAGEAMGDQFAKHPHVFPNVYVQLVRAGEASGKLDMILQRLTDFLTRSAETQKRAKKAIRKPLTMLGMIGLIVVGMLSFVVPRMTEMFTKVGKELPGPTKILITLSDFLLNHYILLIGGCIIGYIFFQRWKRTDAGRLLIDEWVLRIPLISYFSKTKAVVQFSQTLGMLMESGVNLSEALDIVVKIVENRVLTKKLEEARDNIIKDGKIAAYLKETGMFPKMASYMISTGEESGKLAEMLLSVGNDYDAELFELTDTLTEAIDPIMKVVMGLIVMFIVAAIFLPIMQMGDMSGI